jgi:hypothetical protein
MLLKTGYLTRFIAFHPKHSASLLQETSPEYSKRSQFCAQRKFALLQNFSHATNCAKLKILSANAKILTEGE